MFLTTNSTQEFLLFLTIPKSQINKHYILHLKQSGHLKLTTMYHFLNITLTDQNILDLDIKGPVCYFNIFTSRKSKYPFHSQFRKSQCNIHIEPVALVQPRCLWVFFSCFAVNCTGERNTGPFKYKWQTIRCSQSSSSLMQWELSAVLAKSEIDPTSITFNLFVV